MEEDQGDVPGPISIAAAVSATVETDAEDAGPAGEAAGDDTGDGHDHGAEAGAEEESDAPVEARLAVFGDSDFAANGSLGIQGNRDLVLNAINWLAEQENLISIRPREPEDRRITVTADQQFRIFAASIFLIPGVIVGAGVYTWWRRR